MSIFMILCMALAAFLAMPGYGDAKTLYVSPSGSGQGCTQTNPCALDRAVQQAGRGDTVRLAPGLYRQRLTTGAAGVTFIGADAFKSRLVWPGGSGGNHIVAIKHDDTTLMGMVIDGEEKAGKGHGLVRFYTSKNILIYGNRILNSQGTLVSVGGSVPGSKIANVRIIGNHLEAAGYGPEYGEGVYVGSNNSPAGSVKDIEIAGNHLEDFADNGIDLKASSLRVHIHLNTLAKQVARTKTGNHGTIVAQGTGHRIENNWIRDVDGGSSIFNLGSSSAITVTGNSVQNVQGQWLVRPRTGGNTSPTLVARNWFCHPYPVNTSLNSGLLMENNDLALPASICQTRGEVIEARAQQFVRDQHPDPVKATAPLPPHWTR